MELDSLKTSIFQDSKLYFRSFANVDIIEVWAKLCYSVAQQARISKNLTTSGKTVKTVMESQDTEISSLHGTVTKIRIFQTKTPKKEVKNNYRKPKKVGNFSNNMHDKT
ncbi:hypothetical protein AB6A40_010829 [Gnathostoma spinigerum]|uniref:Uncharacterized protein n=1 Tax=Gnathostoma spinigerum TaxID=75299 RepID=A0ABD6F3Z7_9BILA